MRVITFARYFPSYHPRKGEPTQFVEKINAGLSELGIIVNLHDIRVIPDWSESVFEDCEPKYHTIRAGHRWKVGDKFSPRVWSGRSYNSPQVIIGPDIEVKRAWNIEIKANDKIIIDHCDFGTFCEVNPDVIVLAKNDGLSTVDLLNWFPNNKGFEGQIICWNENIEY